MIKMNKEWFVFKGTQHVGPFSLEEMEEFYRNGEINAQTLIWKEGNEKWEALNKTETFYRLLGKKTETLPVPDLEMDAPPPVPHAPCLPSPPVEALNEEELPPPIPLEAIIDPKGHIRERIKTEEKKNRFSKWALLSGVVLFAVILGWYALTQKEAAITLRIKGIMPVYLEKLEMTATKNSPRFEVALALSLDSLTLWASTNFSGEINTVISMNSLPNRVLGTEDVALTVKGKMNNHVGKFNKMVLSRGSKFLPGEYSYHVEGRTTHFLNRHFKSLSSFSFFRDLNKTYFYDGTTLIYPGTPREFEKRLSDFGANILNERLRPFADKLERIQTFESILNSTSQLYLAVLEKAKKGKDITAFETQFIKELSPLLQSLVVKAHELSLDPKIMEEDAGPSSVAPYKGQVQLGKQIGEMASDMITKTQKFKKLADKDKSALRAEFDQRAKSIKLQIDINIKKLEEQIQKISR